jgi:YVTN family beta-propeller protein
MLVVAGATESGESGLCFGVLGPLQVTRSGQRLGLGGRQQRAVLAMLLAESGAVVSVGRLADELWGEETPTGFVTTVQTYVFRLREILEPGRGHGEPWKVLVTESGSGYRLDIGGSSVDSAVFEGSVRAGREAMDRGAYEDAAAELAGGLGLWRGEVLADLADLGFVGPIAARLQEMRLVAQGLRIEAELALGRHDGALPEIDRLIADHSLREQFHAQRMTALYRGGRQSDALAAYRELRGQLHDELGIEPSPPLQELHRAILAQDPALAWHPTSATALAAVGSGGGVKSSSAVSTPPTPPPVPVLDGDQPRHRPGRRVVAAWAVAALVAAGGLTTGIVALSRANGSEALAANSVGAMQPDGSISAAVQVGTDPVGLAFGGGALWVASRSDGRVSRLDPGTHTVIQTIDVGDAPQALTVTAGDVWVANFSDDTVSRINISANEVVATITVGNRPAAIGSGPSGVWVANSGDNTIQRIDLLTSKPGNPFPVGDGPDGIAVDAGSVWVANGRDGTVSRIDPRTGDEISSPVRVGSGPKGIALSGDEVWVANQGSTSVSRINGSTGLARSIVVGDGPSSVVVAGGAVWVSEEFSGVLTRIDPTTDAVQRFTIGSSPRGLAAVGSQVWVAAGAFADPKHSGGTLTVAAPANELDTFSAERLVYDGLVAFRLARGADSQAPVPDLAFAIPAPSNGGRTYTFTLRSGVKYSTGREVHASDFKLGVRRALTLTSGRPDFFAGIVGGRNCVDHPDACDLSSGVVTDDATRRVTFHLGAPDPEFLYKLARYVHPAPPGTSLTQVTTSVPGTGPYRITDYAEGKRLNLVRNRWFRQWSFAAQPAGYPDVIRWLVTADTRASLAAVISGRADVTQPLPFNLQASSALVSEFKVRYPRQVYSERNFATIFEGLDVAVPPFNNLKARQAVNYAVDRNKLVEVFGGPSVAVPTCQLLPPKFPGDSRYCPYTTGPADGRYHGPDLAKARKLVDESGTKGMSVTIHGPLFAAYPAVNAFFKQVLEQLGYKVTLHQMPDADPTWEFLHNPHSHLQAQMSGWAPDIPLASDFYHALVACGAVSNLSEYCNRGLDQRAASATTLMATDPGAALRAWTEIDRTISDEALVVPVVNPIASTFVSARVGNYQSNQTMGALLSQLWVK